MANYSGQRLLAKPDDRHAARATQEAATRTPPRYAIDPDEIEDACPGCTLIYREGRWQHEPACIFARTPLGDQPG